MGARLTSELRAQILLLDPRYAVAGDTVVGTIDGHRVEVRLDEASGTFSVSRVGTPHSFEAGGIRNAMRRLRAGRTSLPLVRLLLRHGWTRAR